jgi:hypothetical protein
MAIPIRQPRCPVARPCYFESGSIHTAKRLWDRHEPCDGPGHRQPARRARSFPRSRILLVRHSHWAGLQSDSQPSACPKMPGAPRSTARHRPRPERRREPCPSHCRESRLQGRLVEMATAVKAGDLRSWRRAKRQSERTKWSQLPRRCSRTCSLSCSTAAEFDASRALRFVGGHACPNVLLGEHSKGECAPSSRSISTRRDEKRFAKGFGLSQTEACSLALYDASKACAIAQEIRSQRLVSTSSCFRPALVKR